MSEYDFWQAQLAGEEPAAPDGPMPGYYVSERHISLPLAIPSRKGGTVHRVKCRCPVAIWIEDDALIAMVRDPVRDWTMSGVAVEELWPSICRHAVSYEDYLSMRKTIEDWRKGR